MAFLRRARAPCRDSHALPALLALSLAGCIGAPAPTEEPIGCLADGLSDAAAPDPVALSLPARWHRMPAGFFGVNQNYIAAVPTRTQVNPAWTASAVVEAMAELAPATVRFPGGTVSDFYDWRRQGIVEPVDGPGVRRELAWHRRVQADQAGFLRLMDRLGADALFVANLYQSAAPDTVEWASSLVAEDGALPAVTRWELGNELNLHPWHGSFGWGTQIDDVEDYLARAEPLGRRLLARWPRLSVAVNAEAPNHLFARKTPRRDPASAVEWNEAVSERPDFYNAVAMHVYLYHHGDWEVPLHERVAWLHAAGDELPAGLARWHARFFDQYPLWLTEFGVTDDHDQWGLILAELSAALQLVAEPGPVTMVLRHMGFAKGTRGVALQISQAPDGEVEMRWLATGRALGWLNARLQGAPLAGRLQTGDGPVFRGRLQYADRSYPAVSGVAVRGDAGEHLFVVNRSPCPVSVRLPPGNWRLHYLAAGLEAPVGDIEPVYERVAGGDTTWSLPPYAFAVADRDEDR